MIDNTSSEVARLDERLKATNQWLHGGLEGVNHRMDKIESTMTDGFARMEESENRRKGAMGLMHWLAGCLGGLVAIVASHFWK